MSEFEITNFDEVVESICDEHKIKIQRKKISVFKNKNTVLSLNFLYQKKQIG